MSLLNLIIPKYIIRHENVMTISVNILFNSKCLTPIAIGINNNEAARYFRFLLLKIHMYVYNFCSNNSYFDKKCS